MGRPAFFVDNLLNPRIYPDHVVTASSTASGTSVRALSAGRRRRGLTGWYASELDTAAYVWANFNQPRAFDFLWIDRDHNLSGEQVGLGMSDDQFTTQVSLTTQTVPSVASPNTRLRSGTLFRTNEGALGWYLGLQVAHEVRIRFPAMGTGLRPEIAGMGIGMLWSPTHAAQKPYAPSRPTPIRSQPRSEFAQWTGGAFGSYRQGTLALKCSSFWEAETGRLHIESLYAERGHGMVTIPDDEAAERAVFGFCPPGSPVGFEVSGDWGYPQVRIPVNEEDPVIR